MYNTLLTVPLSEKEEEGEDEEKKNELVGTTYSIITCEIPKTSYIMV